MKSRCCVFLLLLATSLMPASCGIQAPPEPLQEELNVGLILMYPGISSAPTDMINWHTAFRNANIKQAIRVQPYGPILDLVGNLVEYERNREWSKGEAESIVEYMDAYPGRPVTLIGYSGGGAIAPMVAEYLPDGYTLDRILLFSSGFSPAYDLSPALEKTEKGIVHFWSPVDFIGPLFTVLLGTMDRFYELPAAAVGFDMQDERLIQFAWTPDMVEFNNNGDYTDYLWNDLWVEEFVAPWIARDDGHPTTPIPPELEGRILITSGQE